MSEPQRYELSITASAEVTHDPAAYEAWLAAQQPEPDTTQESTP